MLAAVFLAVSGCIYLERAIDRQPVTRVESADIASGTPPLAAFVLRVAVREVPLDGEQAARVGEIAKESEQWARPIDEARAVFIEVLVRSVEERRVSPGIEGAAADVVRTTREAAPKYDAALRRLHAALEPSQRQELAQRVSGRFSGWAGEWKGGVPADHRWLGSIGTARLESSEADATATAQQWVDALAKEVRDKAELPSLDEPGRRELVARLRRSSTK